MTENGKVHSYYLDALKFFSMIIVFLTHLRMAFFHDKFTSVHIGPFQLRNYAFNGNLAVCMFLLISVYIFCRKSFSTIADATDFIGICKKRYVRLFVPAFLVNFLIFLMSSFHLFFNVNVFDDSVPYVNSWFNFGGILKAFYSMIWGDMNICLFENGFNPPLWCYHLLFYFPLLAYGSIQLLKDERKIVLVSFLILPLCLLNNTYFSVIPFAVIIASEKMNSINKAYIMGGGISVALLCILLHSLSLTVQSPVFNRFSISLNIVLAASVLNLFELLGDKKIFNNKIFYHLNKIGFGIYLLHMPIICSVGFYLYRITGNLAVTIIAISAVLIVASLAFHIFVEKKLLIKIIDKMQ